MTVKPEKMLSIDGTAELSAMEKFLGETKPDAAKHVTENPCIAGDIPIYNVRWYPSNKSCVKISDHRRSPQNTPPLMVRKAEWRR